ncbi:MAG: sulfatase-like hydrolase/transferase [Verrucomicrobiae bacterium]|nr:sulfatase-like hydrolase/transferase [Verrucomicrobiae bacterium]
MKPILASILIGFTCAASLAEKPNVLLICVDDLKPLLGCYGVPIIKSPNIDRLAARGMLFERAFCNQAVCAPSRNALMTGLRPQTVGIYDLGTNFRKATPNAVTVAQHFRAHGYRAEALGKIMHTGQGNHEDPESWTVPHWRPKGGGYKLPESMANPKPRKDGSLRGASTECADVPDNAYADGMIADEAIARLRAAKEKPGEPWFIAVGFPQTAPAVCRAEKILGPLPTRVIPASQTEDATHRRA